MQHQSTFSIHSTKKERKAEIAILLLYLFFFVSWLTGYILGIFESETYTLWGLPLWFLISSIFSFIAVCLGLRFVIKRVFV